MKKKLFFYLLPFILLAGACKEQFSGVNLTPPPAGALYDSANFQANPIPAVEQKRVLLEDFTGVSCPNCPNADAEDDALHTQYGSQIVSICEFPLLSPLSDTPYDAHSTQVLISNDASNNYILLGNPGSLPEGAFDRKVYPGQDTAIFALSTNVWPAVFASEVTTIPSMNVDIDTMVYNPGSGKLTVTIKVVYTSAAAGPNYISAAITEDSIIEPQKKGGVSTPVSNYVHNHVLRGFIYPSTGLQLGSTSSYSPGNTYLINFSTYINLAVWKPNHCNVVAFVHNETVSNLQVLQATIAPIVK